MNGLEAAKAAGLDPVKVNAVLDPVTGLDDAVALLRFCLDHGYQLRIIEQMPLDAGHEWKRGEAIAADDVLAVLRRHFDLRPDSAPRGSAPAELWDGRRRAAGKVGIIASVSHAFCAACDRTRLTADGQIRNCLFARHETDLRRLHARGRRRRRADGRLARRDVGQGGRPRHQRPGLRAAGPPDERDRRLSGGEKVTVRYFAAARAAAGFDDEIIGVAPGTTIATLMQGLGERDAELAKVLSRCSYLCDGIAVRDIGADVERRSNRRCSSPVCRRISVIYVT